MRTVHKKSAWIVGISVLRRLPKKKNRDEETVADDLDLSLEYVHRINELLSAYPMESDEEIVKRIVDND